MKLILNKFLILATLGIFLSCTPRNPESRFEAKIIYQSDNLVITQLSEHCYQHTSFLATESFGTVDCNGMLVCEEREMVVFDTPADSGSSGELIRWAHNTLNTKIVGVVATHFHIDCVGGLSEFHRQEIPSYANYKTMNLANEKGYNVPKNGFRDSLLLKVGNTAVEVRFLGEGHTRDNVVAYFHREHIMFGGCLIKGIGAGKGNLEDADTATWPVTIGKIKRQYPNVKLVIPGHGKFGNRDLLDYTEKLFENK